MIHSIKNYDDHSRGVIYSDFSWVLVLPSCVTLKGECGSEEEAQQALADARHQYEVAMGFKKEAVR